MIIRLMIILKKFRKSQPPKKKMQRMIFTGNLPLKIFDIEGEANFIAIEFFVDHKGIRSQTESWVTALQMKSDD